MIIIISAFIVFAIFAWGILWRNSSILYETLYRGDTSKKCVALTFDDGPHPDFTPQILDILKLYNAKATFFCVGRLAESYPDVVRRIQNEGHLVANHTYEHTWQMYMWGPQKVKSSIEKAGNILEQITGIFPRFYRPPVGIKTPPQMMVAWRTGLKFVGWSRWAVDGGRRTLTVEKTRKMINETRNGDIFLLHDGKINADGSPVNNESHGAAIEENLPALIKGLQARGYELVALDKLLGMSGNIERSEVALESTPVQNLRSVVKALFNAFLQEHLSPFRLSLAIAVGILIGCSPFFGLHALIGIMVAARFRLNKLATFIGTNISNPLTGPFVIVASIQVGWRILYGSWLTHVIDIAHVESIWSLGNRILASWLVGFPLVGAAVGFAVMTFLYPILLLWQKRRGA